MLPKSPGLVTATTATPGCSWASSRNSAPVQRKLFYLRAADAAAHFHVAAIDARRLGLDIDAFVAVADAEREIKREVIADL